jgi:hypothetical protein
LDRLRLKRALDDVASLYDQRRRVRALEEQLLRDLEFHGIVGKSPVMLEVFDFARKVARHYTNVLLVGPTGTGKELVARAIHYQQLDALRTVRQQVRRELFAEAKKHQAWKQLCQIPSLGPIRAAVLLGILQTPHRFRTKRQLWSYSGFGIETHSSADHRSVDGQLKRVKKQSSIRGLNRNCNHDLKNLFKGAAIVASSKPGPFQEFYTALLTKGIRPEMARLTLARKIATIVLMVWKRGACFDAQHLKPQTA